MAVVRRIPDIVIAASLVEYGRVPLLHIIPPLCHQSTAHLWINVLKKDPKCAKIEIPFSAFHLTTAKFTSITKHKCCIVLWPSKTYKTGQLWSVSDIRIFCNFQEFLLKHCVPLVYWGCEDHVQQCSHSNFYYTFQSGVVFPLLSAV